MDEAHCSQNLKNLGLNNDRRAKGVGVASVALRGPISDWANVMLGEFQFSVTRASYTLSSYRRALFRVCDPNLVTRQHLA